MIKYVEGTGPFLVVFLIGKFLIAPRTVMKGNETIACELLPGSYGQMQRHTWVLGFSSMTWVYSSPAITLHDYFLLVVVYLCILFAHFSFNE